LINDYDICFVAIVKFLPNIQLTNFDTENRKDVCAW
jgi:hypothetical protein